MRKPRHLIRVLLLGAALAGLGGALPLSPVAHAPVLGMALAAQPDGRDPLLIPWEAARGGANGLVPVVMHPQQELAPAGGKLPGTVRGIPFTLPQGGRRSVLAARALARDAYTSSGMARSPVQGQTFTARAGSPAYAAYQVRCPSAQQCTVGLVWYSPPEDMAQYFVGLGDEAGKAWRWFAGPQDHVLTFDPRAIGVGGGDSLLVCVAVSGGRAADFMLLESGAPEMRGMGLAMPPEWQRALRGTIHEWALRPLTREFPPACSIVQWASPVVDQQTYGSCVACSLNSGCMNLLLNQLYGNYGWDSAQEHFQVSQMYLYVKCGQPPYPESDPLCGPGRNPAAAMLCLYEVGTCTYPRVPYSDQVCPGSFPSETDREAALLKISDGGICLFQEGMDIDAYLDGIKDQLVNFDRPVEICWGNVQQSFTEYKTGVYQTDGSQGLGGHAMCILGYDDAQRAFLVRNSWGADWGMDGYCWFGYDSLRRITLAGEFMWGVIVATYNPDTQAYFCGS